MIFFFFSFFSCLNLQFCHKKVFEFSYTGEGQSIVLEPGLYLIELCGASGADYNGADNYVPFTFGGKGGYVSGTFVLNQSITVFVHCGGVGIEHKTYDSIKKITPGGFNGGGSVFSKGLVGSGGGASEIRFLNDDIDHAVMIAGGGGGASFLAPGGDGGGLYAGASTFNTNVGTHVYTISSGGNQTHGGIIVSRSLSYDIETSNEFINGGFSNSYGDYRIGGNGLGRNLGGGGGGGGLYGGCGGLNVGGGGGGSSYAFTQTSVLPPNYAFNQNESFLFKNVTHYQGACQGNGYAKITLLNPICYEMPHNLCTIHHYRNYIVFTISMFSIIALILI